MEQKWIHFLVILAFYQKIASGAGGEKAVKEGDPAEITCRPPDSNAMIIWFRVLDKSGMEFIASYSGAYVKKPNTKAPSSIFIETKIAQNTLILQSFKEAVDSGIYTCATLHKGTELKFGEVTRLVGVKETAATPPSNPIDKEQSPCTEAPPCKCSNSNGNTKAEVSPSMFCTPLILGPLAGGCGLLLLLLIITALYCNKIRTRRCPHHHKRKPRTAADGKQMPTRQY